MIGLRTTCQALRQQLSAFVDGELPGGEMLRLAEHLEVCRECAREVADLRGLGDGLREAASQLAPAPALAGLADGVISRVGAEAAQSWRAVFARAIEDWHWAIVGFGSVAATSATLLFVWMLLAFGPEPASSESLAALMNNLRRPAGTVILMATPIGHDREATLMLLDNGGSDEARGAVGASLGQDDLDLPGSGLRDEEQREIGGGRAIEDPRRRPAAQPGAIGPVGRAPRRREHEERRPSAAQGHARDPDGAPLYPGLHRGLSPDEVRRRLDLGEPAALRIDMERALKAAREVLGSEPLTFDSGVTSPDGVE